MNIPVWPLVLASAENFVLINLALSGMAVMTASIARVSESSRKWHPFSLMRFYAAALIIPPVASAWLVFASLLPALWLGPGKWVAEHNGQHTFHLLNALTFRLDPLLGYSAFFFVLAAAVMALCASAKAYLQLDRIMSSLQIDAEPALPDRVKQVEDACRRYGLDVGLVVSRYPFSFVWGYLRSKLVVSTGLLNALTAAELAALLEHEAAHHVRRDNLLKWILSVCQYVSPIFPLTGLVYRWWNEQVEMVCDEVAAKQTNAPVEVAAALVRLRRLTLTPLSLRPQTTGSSFFGERGDSFAERVTRLLSLADPHVLREAVSLSRSWLRTAVFSGMIFAATLAVLFVISPLAVHRLIEVLLHRS